MNIAFAGFRHSHIFSLYDAALQSEMIHISGCYEENPSERENIAKTRGIKFTYAAYEELLNDETVNAVAIGDYYGKRGKMVIEALEHGKHVICDKPICTDLNELDKIERISAEKNLQVGCMLELRYMPQTMKAKELIESGALGDIHIVSFTGQHPLNFASRPKWYFEEGKHGGTINDIAIHGIDLVRFLTKKNLTKVDYARTWNAFADKAPDFKDCGQFMIEMDDMSLMADVSYAAPSFSGLMPTYWSFYFWGSKGMMNFNLQDPNLYIFRETKETIACTGGQPEYLRDFIHETNGIRTIMNSGEIIESQRQTLKIQKFADNL